MQRGVYARLRRFNLEKTNISAFLASPCILPGSGMNASSFGTIDFRVSRQCANPLDLLCNKTSNWFNFETNFSVRLVSAKGTLSDPVQLRDYLSLTGPVGSLVFGFGTAGHPILQTARIPLTAFGNQGIVSKLRGVRFTFDDTRRDEIYLANIQLSRRHLEQFEADVRQDEEDDAESAYHLKRF